MRDQMLAMNVTPARKAGVVRLTIDTTARAYSIQALKLGRDAAPAAEDPKTDVLYVRLLAETATIYYQFADDDTVTLDNSTAVAAGGTLAETNTYGEPLLPGTFIDVEIRRDTDKYLHVQGSAAGFLTIRAASMVGR